MSLSTLVKDMVAYKRRKRSHFNKAIDALVASNRWLKKGWMSTLLIDMFCLILAGTATLVTVFGIALLWVHRHDGWDHVPSEEERWEVICRAK